jgi:hypothetical protein
MLQGHTASAFAGPPSTDGLGGSLSAWLNVPGMQSALHCPTACLLNDSKCMRAKKLYSHHPGSRRASPTYTELYKLADKLAFNHLSIYLRRVMSG